MNGPSLKLRIKKTLGTTWDGFIDSPVVGWTFTNAVGVTSAAAILSLVRPPSILLVVAGAGLWIATQYTWRQAHVYAELRSGRT